MPPSTTARNTSAAEAVPPSATARNTSAAEAVPPSATARNTSAAEAVPPSTTARNTSAAEAVPPSTTARNTSAAEAVPPSTTARNTSAAEAVLPSTIGSPPNSQTQVDKEQEPRESDGEKFPEPEQFETDAEDSERQDMYEDDFVKSESQHSSSSSNSSANEESKTRTASISSASSRLSEESSSPDVKESSTRLSETKSIPVDVSAKILSNLNMAPAVNASEESDNNVFEEPEIEENVEQQDDKQMESTDSVQQPAMSPIEQTVLTTDDLELERNASENYQPISEDLHDTDVCIQAEEKGRTIIDSLENETTSSVPKEEPVITSHQSSPQLSQVNIHPENIATTSSSLSASFTLKEAVKVLEKTHSLHSILNDNSSKTASSVDLSEPDEDIPNLEQKILELPTPNFIEAKQTPPTKTENQQTVQNEGSTQEVNNVLLILDNQADADREPRDDHFESDATSSHLPAAVKSSTGTLATEDQANNTTNITEQDNSLSQLDDTVSQSENESNIEQNQLLVSSRSPRPSLSSSLTSVSSHSDNVIWNALLLRISLLQCIVPVQFNKQKLN